jgi:chromosome segregation ATPase
MQTYTIGSLEKMLAEARGENQQLTTRLEEL